MMMMIVERMIAAQVRQGPAVDAPASAGATHVDAYTCGAGPGRLIASGTGVHHDRTGHLHHSSVVFAAAAEAAKVVERPEAAPEQIAQCGEKE